MTSNMRWFLVLLLACIAGLRPGRAWLKRFRGQGLGSRAHVPAPPPHVSVPSVIVHVHLCHRKTPNHKLDTPCVLLYPILPSRSSAGLLRFRSAGVIVPLMRLLKGSAWAQKSTLALEYVCCFYARYRTSLFV